MFGSGFRFESLLRIAELFYVAYAELTAYGLQRLTYMIHVLEQFALLGHPISNFNRDRVDADLLLQAQACAGRHSCSPTARRDVGGLPRSRGTTLQAKRCYHFSAASRCCSGGRRFPMYDKRGHPMVSDLAATTVQCRSGESRDAGLATDFASFWNTTYAAATSTDSTTATSSTDGGYDHDYNNDYDYDDDDDDDYYQVTSRCSASQTVQEFADSSATAATTTTRSTRRTATSKVFVAPYAASASRWWRKCLFLMILFTCVMGTLSAGVRKGHSVATWKDTEKTSSLIPPTVTGTVPLLLWSAASNAIEGKDTARSAASIFWTHAIDSKNYAVFGDLYETLAIRMALTTRSRVLDLMVAHLVVIRTMMELARHLRKAKQGKRLSRKLARLIRLLPPGVAMLIATWDSAYIATLVSVINAEGVGTQAAVYALWCSTMFYIGKCGLLRKTGVPGIPARVGEHLRLTMWPWHRDGRRLRYIHLRTAGLLAVRFLPMVILPTGPRALAVESLLILLEVPNGNDRRADGDKVRPQKLKSPQPRRRPSSWVRRKQQRGKKQPQSLWADPAFAKQLRRHCVAQDLGRRHDLLDFGGPLGLQRHYRLLYTIQLRALFAATGCYGPLDIFHPDRLVLWLSLLAVNRAPSPLPPSWARDQRADFLYKSVENLPLIRQAWRRARVRATLEGYLRKHRLPPTRLQPLPLPRTVLHRARAAVANVVWSTTACLRSVAACQWLRQGVTYVKAATVRWSSVVTAPRQCRTFSRSTLARYSVRKLAALSSMPSLTAVPAPWRLARWPTQRSIQQRVATAWNNWAEAARLTPRFIRRGRQRLWSAAAEWSLPSCTPQWAAHESAMSAAVDDCSDYTICGDDKGTSKMWRVKTKELHAYMVSSLLEAPGWTLTRLTLSTVRAFELARAAASLPPFLTRHLDRKHELPTAFPLFKSKCWGDNGAHKCNKPGHSCVRRVINSGSVPFKSSWQLVSRALRAILVKLDVTNELHDLSSFHSVFDRRYQAIQHSRHSTTTCLCCGVPLSGVTLVTADIDQAFEACTTSSVMPACRFFLAAFRHVTGSNEVKVHRSKRPRVSLGKGGYGGPTVCLDIPHLIRALMGYTLITFVAYGDMIFKMSGLPIGGVMSMVCVSMVLGYAEYCWQHNSAERNLLGFAVDPIDEFFCWLRYVDDTLCITYIYCGKCTFNFLSAAYKPVKLTAVSGVDQPLETHTWTDIEFRVCGLDVHVLPKNPNRKWLHGLAPRERAMYCDWLGVLPMPFGILRACLLGKLARARQLNLSAEWQTYRLLEEVLELWHSQYPVLFLRKLVHSLPASPAVRRLRILVRQWISIMKSWGNGNKGQDSDKSYGRSYKGKNFKDDSKESGKPKEKTKKKKTRGRSSSTSSSSSEHRRVRKVSKARRLLAREDSGYRRHLAEMDRKETAESANVQASALKDALAGAFDNLMPHQQFPPLPPALGGGVPSGSAPIHPGGSLSPAQAMLLEASLGNVFRLGAALDRGTVIETMRPHFKPPKNRPTLQAWVQRFAPTRVLPVTHQEILDMLYDTVKAI